MVTRGRIIVALSYAEAVYLRELLRGAAAAAEADGALYLADDPAMRAHGAALLRGVAGRIEQTLTCPACGQYDAHAADCRLRTPERD